jgi:hypothetical protein
MKNFRDLFIPPFLRSSILHKRRHILLPKLAREAGRQSKEENESLQKGHDFEKFVLSRFKTDTYFTLLEWRSDKGHNGIYPVSCMFPDLELLFQSNYKTIRFAVECKWRNGFTNSWVQWAKDYQFENYTLFQRETKIPVYVALGVAGLPSDPGQLFIIPLNRIKSINLNETWLAQYKRYSTTQMFFLDADSLELR